MKNLIGKECACVFDLPSHSWPIKGYPAWVVVEDIAPPLIKMRSKFGGEPMWLNMNTIESIRAEREEPMAAAHRLEIVRLRALIGMAAFFIAVLGVFIIFITHNLPKGC